MFGIGADMREEVLSEAAKRKFLLSPDALELILSNNDPLSFSNTIFSHLSTNKLILTRQDIEDAITGDKVLFKSEPAVKRQNRFTPDIHIVKGTDITGESTCEGKINDFAQYFRSRYVALRRLLEKRSDFGRPVDINVAKDMDRTVKIAGLVYDKNTTKNGHTMVTVEDPTGTAKVFISKESPLANELFVTDECVGVIGKFNQKGTMFMAEKIVRPDIPLNNKWELSDAVSKVAFLSDVHVGSCTFLEHSWLKMVDWLKHNSESEEINYIIFPGDVVDGIGVFPDQDKELELIMMHWKKARKSCKKRKNLWCQKKRRIARALIVQRKRQTISGFWMCQIRKLYFIRKRMDFINITKTLLKRLSEEPIL